MKAGTNEKSYRTFVGNAIYVSVPRLIDPRVKPEYFPFLVIIITERCFGEYNVDFFAKFERLFP